MNVRLSTIFYCCFIAPLVLLVEFSTVVQSVELLPVKSWEKQTVMFMYAHIDDAECLAGGLISQLTAQGSDVHLVIMTNGDKGCSNPDMCATLSREELIEQRQQEQYASAAVLSIPQENIHFLGYEDVQLKQANRTEVSEKLVGLVRNIQPSAVFCWDSTPHFNMLPNKYGDLGYHPDHQYTGELTIDVIWMSKLDRLWPHLGQGFTVNSTYFWVTNPDYTPTHYVDISDGHALALKTRAMSMMKSQLGDNEHVQALSWMVALGVEVAANCDLPSGSVAEGYQYVLW